MEENHFPNGRVDVFMDLLSSEIITAENFKNKK